MTQTTLAEEWLGKGQLLFESQEYEKAIMSYEQAIRIVPQLAIAWMKKADALSALNQQEEAIAAYNEALKIQPLRSNPMTLMFGITRGLPFTWQVNWKNR